MSETVEHEPDQSMYALWSNGVIRGRARYAVRGNALHITHVEIDPELQGQGLAAFLMRDALDEIRLTTDYRVVPECSYAVKYFNEHPVYQDLLERGR
ncbi:GNAT family N-acetyltransferase [Homoserinimonas sp. OAct 916]|uniref:GNAT family N-acetyltransferase n=1 Tax=Homoserinimonas sp. OAct 916 TaxID=2211450 RepID=UPI000DBE0BBA|nr:GNAT family N-acetyltransferase [Homoserinimonas sp. OAct 916]